MERFRSIYELTNWYLNRGEVFIEESYSVSRLQGIVKVTQISDELFEFTIKSPSIIPLLSHYETKLINLNKCVKAFNIPLTKITDEN